MTIRNYLFALFRSLSSTRAQSRLFIMMASLATTLPVHALPSFARQTGQECAACHVGSFGPQLTPYGVRFKMEGYTDSDGKPGKIPLSAMLVQTWTRTSKDIPADEVTAHFGSNNNASLQEVSAFLAGGFGEHVGTFAQATYSDIDRKVAMDNVDVRLVNNFKLAGKDATAGVSINNNPSVQDPFNTTPAWRFPYASSELAPTSVAQPLLDGGLAQQVIGASAYGVWNKSFYGELGLYRSLSKGFLNDVNVLATGDPLDKLQRAAPYWRLAYFKDLRTQAYSVGLFGMDANIQPEGADATDKYRDIGIDGMYQFLGKRRHIASVYGSYLREDRTLDATYAGGAGADTPKGTLNQLRVNASYYYDKTYGVTLGLFDTHGDKDITLYGTRTGKPDTNGATLQVDWTPFGKEDSWGAPWANMRVGAQYTWYDKFNGASSNYDGNGRNASDNDTLFLFLWAAI